MLGIHGANRNGNKGQCLLMGIRNWTNTMSKDLLKIAKEIGEEVESTCSGERYWVPHCGGGC